ncbi:MAG TPA: hypothetical protein K8V15_09415 [Tessaracoccus flavescens]|uniref:Uncharacterized protein n=1 Tax=Tessaracoccus flavescens TaxID=399497 RepID=A0A921ERI6_9ACTN|nr:hypothetical protein [Tessaracoccus flavescens]
MKKLGVLAGAIGVALAPVFLLSPRRKRAAGVTVEELVRSVASRGLEGRALVDAAIAAVAEAYPMHCLWRLWRSPERSLSDGCGWSHQYNTVLLLVLRGLGVRCRLVHAARVRGFGHPWFLVGHTWVKVTHGGWELDACASRPGNRLGDPPFVALTPELPMRRLTRWAVGAALVPFVVAEVWASWLGDRDVAPWMQRPNA